VEPWQTVEGIEFRSVTVEAYKGKEGVCLDANQAVVYKGPFKEVIDDDDHAFVRGERIAVCEKTYKIYSNPPYAEHFERVPPQRIVMPEELKPFDCTRDVVRSPRETKGDGYSFTSDPSQCCGDEGCC